MRRTTTRRLAVVVVKSVHTLIWVLVEGAVGYLLFAGVTRRSDRRAATAGVVVAAESIVYLANGARCPLTGLAESLGAENGAVTDLYLPRWLARNLPVHHIPLLALILILHRRPSSDASGLNRLADPTRRQLQGRLPLGVKSIAGRDRHRPRARRSR